MKRRHVFVGVSIIILLAVFSFPVSAMVPLQDTSTPAPTASLTAPAGYVPTVKATQNYGCGEGLPVNWGTVTPDPAWSLLCRACIPDESGDLSYTLTPVPGTITPTATGTPPTVTPTVTPVSGGCGSDLHINPTYNLMWNYWLGSTTGIFVAEGSPVTCTKVSDSTIVCNGHREMDYGFPSGYGQLWTWIGFQTTPGTHIYTSIQWSGSAVPLVPTFGYCESGCTLDVPFDDFIAPADETYGEPYTGTTISLTHQRLFFGDTVGMGESVNYDFEIRISLGEACLDDEPADPTPTPAPSGLIYCDIVNGEGTEALDDFGWSGVTVTYGSCFDIGPWEPPFPSVSDFGGIPWLAHICMAEINLGVVTLFGVSLSLLMVAYVSALAWALRNLFVS